MIQLFKMKTFENSRVSISPPKNDKNNFANIFRNYISNIFVSVSEYTNPKMEDDSCKQYTYKYLNT